MDKITPTSKHYDELRGRAEAGLNMGEAAHDLQTSGDKAVSALELQWIKIPVPSAGRFADLRVEAAIDRSAGSRHKLIFHVLDIPDTALRTVNTRVQDLLSGIFAQIPGDLLVVADPNPIFRSAWDLLIAQVPATHSAFLFAKVMDTICTSFGGPTVYDAARAAAIGAPSSAS